MSIRKSCSALCRASWSLTSFGTSGTGRGRQSRPLYVSYNAWNISSWSGVKLSLISPSGSHSDSVSLWYPSPISPPLQLACTSWSHPPIVWTAPRLRRGSDSAPSTTYVSASPAPASLESVCSWNGAPQSGSASMGGEVSALTRATRAMPCYVPHGVFNLLTFFEASQLSLNRSDTGGASEL